MTSYPKALFYIIFFLFVAVAIHEVGHLIVARRLISESARVHFFPSFPFGRILGLVSIPNSSFVPLWKGLMVSITGPLLSTILMSIILLNTRNPTIGVVSSFFAIHQLSYSLIEPLLYLGKIPVWTTMLPVIAGGAWVLPYAYHIRKNPQNWD
ncbi:hypothetical protein AKJ50_00945 [candidate division MSBL1 archaeon SCGC-AAA382A13]|uniref:Uncharacterized protein n=1 Tax=candidate division MSBL1 archaeon SCGC-AAA382A13 TaxID=1698279 RepID=A0A133VG69_9EURY|nr:hypothetical protein AKJ50_00945 [candidate division MSBL1 archaeon SCGC-AAA382A13]